MLLLYSYSMDCAWGVNGLDGIITQLFQQFENTGYILQTVNRFKPFQEIMSILGWNSPCKVDYETSNCVWENAISVSDKIAVV